MGHVPHGMQSTGAFHTVQCNFFSRCSQSSCVTLTRHVPGLVPSHAPVSLVIRQDKRLTHKVPSMQDTFTYRRRTLYRANRCVVQLLPPIDRPLKAVVSAAAGT